MKTITILGSTGSIGLNTLDVVSRNADDFQIFALTAHSNVERMLEQCLQFQPHYAVMVDEIAAKTLIHRLEQHSVRTQVLSGLTSLDKVASHESADTVVAAIVGAAGLSATLAAAKAGKRILLANKEALVMSGALFMDTIVKNKATLLPVDSEHNAIFQCMPANYCTGEIPKGVERIILTASGGPFRTLPMDQFVHITPEQAIAHPNWAMGRKISVDSATMMNKGLEVIEAHWLFQLEKEKIEVVLHPESIIHSFVEYADGSLLAQMGNPDMRTPIAHTLSWPLRMASGVKRLDLIVTGGLHFEEMDFKRYPCLMLAYQALKAGETAPTILNAANEVAVQAFLDRQIPFMSISEVVDAVLQEIPLESAKDLETILMADEKARIAAKNKM